MEKKPSKSGPDEPARRIILPDSFGSEETKDEDDSSKEGEPAESDQIVLSDESPGDAEHRKKVDESWKQQAKTEKERVSRKVEEEVRGQESGEAERAPGPLPEPTLTGLCVGLYTQALVGLGVAKNPLTGQQQKDMEFAKYNIDMLQMLEDKTRGNLDAAEKQMFVECLYDLRMRYVKAVQ
ncbi:MAG: DUF1844 domain-containing protein [Planctomycetes bacterium]|nr:DUF1844 domain-containing protein [Planctomycetota bacterium]